MRYFIDNNLPPALARALHELTVHRQQASEVRHLSDLFPRNTADSEWIEALSKQADWVIITADKLKKGNEAEILRRSGLITFHLDKSWLTHSYWTLCQNFIRWWPQIIAQSTMISGGAAFRVRWKHTSKTKFEQIK